jgi:hypothetical protein
LKMALQRLPCGALVERQAGGILRVHRGQFSHSDEIVLANVAMEGFVRLS